MRGAQKYFLFISMLVLSLLLCSCASMFEHASVGSYKAYDGETKQAYDVSFIALVKPQDSIRFKSDFKYPQGHGPGEDFGVYIESGFVSVDDKIFSDMKSIIAVLPGKHKISFKYDIPVAKDYRVTCERKDNIGINTYYASGVYSYFSGEKLDTPDNQVEYVKFYTASKEKQFNITTEPGLIYYVFPSTEGLSIGSYPSQMTEIVFRTSEHMRQDYIWKLGKAWYK